MTAPSIVPDRTTFRTDRLRTPEEKWDDQPTQPGRRAHRLERGSHPAVGSALGAGAQRRRPVAVISLARIYGSSFGLPNPGLMPTKKELRTSGRR